MSRQPAAIRPIRVALATVIAGALMLAVPPAIAYGRHGTPKTAALTTWSETQAYTGSAVAVGVCPLGGASGPPGVASACFELYHPYADIASINVSDSALAGVDGDWQIEDPNQIVLRKGPICSGAAQQLPPTIPAGASLLRVLVGDPGAACSSGSPVSTNGTVTVTYHVPPGSITTVTPLPGCPPYGGVPGHVMPHLAGRASPLQPPPAALPCGVPGLPPAGQPAPVNMAYFGGHVQVSPQIYVIFWGWNAPDAFRDARAGSQPADDPDGAAARITSFVGAIGGTRWAGVQTQYYDTVTGPNRYITNPADQLAGVWWDDTDPIHDNLSPLEIGQEAQIAAAHFGVSGAGLDNANFVIATPQDYNEGNFNGGGGYCAYHDYTEPPPSNIYKGVAPGISFTNMPYVIDQGAACGQQAVNSGAAGNLDGESIVLGHEIEETVTDPGAEVAAGGTNLGAWYDYNHYENGDKCAWVGDVIGLPAPVPGGIGTMTGNNGQPYPVQALWSNNAAGGLGYCAGTNDLPL